MISDELRKEWLEKVSTPKRDEIYVSGRWGGQQVTVNTPLRSAPDEVKLDKEIVKTALLKGEEFFWNVEQVFRDNKEFIQDLIDNKYKHDIYKYTYKLQEDTDLFKQCALRDESLCDYSDLPKSIIENKELILELLPFNNFYKGLDNFYKNDKDVLSIYMLKHNPSEFQNLSKRMSNHFSKNKPFLVDLIKINSEAYKSLGLTLQNDLEIIDSLLSTSKYNFNSLPGEIRNDKAFLMYAIPKYGCSLEGCPEILRNDIDLVRLSIKKNGRDLYFSPALKNNIELVEIAMETAPFLDMLCRDLWENVPLVVKYLKKEEELKVQMEEERNKGIRSQISVPSNLATFLQQILPSVEKNNTEAHQEYISNKDIIKLIIDRKENVLNLFPYWNDDVELADYAFKMHGKVEYLHESKLYDKECMLNLLQEKPNLVKPLVRHTTYYMDDYDILKLVLQQAPDEITNSPKGKADPKIVHFALDNTTLSDMKHIDSKLWMDKDIAVKFIAKNPYNYPLLPLELKQDDDIIDKMCQQKLATALLLLKHSGLENDIEFNKKIIAKNYHVYETLSDISPFKKNLDIIDIYLSSLAQYEADTFRSTETKLPTPILKKYNMKDGRPSQVKAVLVKTMLEKELPTKEEVLANKKVKI